MANSGPPLSPGPVPPSSGVVGTCKLKKFGLFVDRGLRNCELKNGWGVFVSGIGPYKPSELVATLRLSSTSVVGIGEGNWIPPGRVFGRQTTPTSGPEPVPWVPYPAMVMVVPAVGKPDCPGCKVSSLTGATLVTGWASDITAISFSRPPGGTKSGRRTKLVMPTPEAEVGANDMDGIPKLFGRKQWAAVSIVRELISEPVHCEPGREAENRLTT